MSESDLITIVDEGIKSFLEQLKSHNVSHVDYPYWLSSAAVNICLAKENNELKDKLNEQQLNDLIGEIRNGYREMDRMLNTLPEEDRERIESSQWHFKDVFGD